MPLLAHNHMKTREFNALLKSCAYGGRGKRSTLLDPSKVAALDSATKEQALRYIVRARGPVLVEFISELTDLNWLASCSYYQRSTGKSGYTFLHTSEHTIR